jgi:trimeric autotransporter adhesin
MKSYLKIAVVMFTIAVLSGASVVYAQGTIGINTSSPTSSNLNSVAIVSNTSTTNPTLASSDAWAVGDGGTIIKWNGTAWSTVNSNTTTNLYSIVMINSTSGLAVGGSSSSGIILKYNGTWSVMSTSSPINATLYGVTADSGGSPAWAVGSNGTILMWNGNQWQQQSSPTKNTLRSVGLVHNSNNAWAVGDNGTIVQYNGSSWSNVTSPTTAQLNAVVMVNTTSGWAVGGNQNTGVIINMNGTTWSNFTKINFGVSTPNATVRLNATLNSLTIDSPTSAWAAGASGMVLYWTGTEWAGQLNVLSVGNIRSIAMVHGAANGTSQAWGVGDGGKIIAWTGTSWIPEIPIIALPMVLTAIALAAFVGKAKLGKKLQV